MPFCYSQGMAGRCWRRDSPSHVTSSPMASEEFLSSHNIFSRRHFYKLENSRFVQTRLKGREGEKIASRNKHHHQYISCQRRQQHKIWHSSVASLSVFACLFLSAGPALREWLISTTRRQQVHKPKR